MQIGTLRLSGAASLAPMAGVTDGAFRALCRSYGAAFTVTEMVSAKALTLGDRKSRALMESEEGERPLAIQIFGADPAVMAQSVAAVLPYRPDMIDLNMGCPAPKIVKNGAGSALMKTPSLAEKIIAAVKAASPVPVTVKMRIGWDENSRNHIEFAKAAEAAGADLITCHGRTRQQMYAPPADLVAIAEVKAAVGIPVIGNGDIFTPEDAKRMYEATGCDLVAVGRGCLGRPWLFGQIASYFSAGAYTEPSKEEKMRVMLGHAAAICKDKGERAGILELRKHALWYTKGMRGAAKLRSRFSTLSSLDELMLLADMILNS